MELFEAGKMEPFPGHEAASKGVQYPQQLNSRSTL